MNQCPKFATCSASVCPLDPHWRRAHYVKGEPVCFYLREAFKTGRISQFQGTVPRTMAETLVSLPVFEIFRLYPSIAARLRAAAGSPSKATAGAAL